MFYIVISIQEREMIKSIGTINRWQMSVFLTGSRRKKEEEEERRRGSLVTGENFLFPFLSVRAT